MNLLCQFVSLSTSRCQEASRLPFLFSWTSHLVSVSGYLGGNWEILNELCPWFKFLSVEAFVHDFNDKVLLMHI